MKRVAVVSFVVAIVVAAVGIGLEPGGGNGPPKYPKNLSTTAGL